VPTESIVHVYLLKEAVHVWRPVTARHLRDDLYVLSGPVRADEVWEFQPGDVVRCKERSFEGGVRALAAVARVGGEADPRG
jgi:hypothetical protein